jgi:hypothetical protein
MRQKGRKVAKGGTAQNNSFFVKSEAILKKVGAKEKMSEIM